jgi:hypothetical protein
MEGTPVTAGKDDPSHGRGASARRPWLRSGLAAWYNFVVSRALRFRPRFDGEFKAVVRGRCAVCGATTSETIAHARPQQLGHCDRIWATFNGIDVVYNGEESMPPVTRS